MDVLTYTDARASLKDVMDRVIHDRVEVVVTRKKREAVVMISLDEYNAIQETLHLQKSLRTPAAFRHPSRNWMRAMASSARLIFEARLFRTCLGRLSLVAVRWQRKGLGADPRSIQEHDATALQGAWQTRTSQR